MEQKYSDSILPVPIVSRDEITFHKTRSNDRIVVYSVHCRSYKHYTIKIYKSVDHVVVSAGSDSSERDFTTLDAAVEYVVQYITLKYNAVVVVPDSRLDVACRQSMDI